VIWMAALTPMVFRKLSERQVTTSVDAFRRQLHGLRRAYPRLAATAAHPEMAQSMARIAYGGPRTTMLSSSAHAASLGTSRARQAADGGGEPARSVRSRSNTTPAVQATTQQAMRRRQVLAILVATVVGTFVLGAIPGLGVLWDLSLIALVATAAYVGLLVYFQKVALEQEQKVVEFYDPRPQRHIGQIVVPYVPAKHARRSDQSEHDEADDEYIESSDGYDEYEELAAAER